MATLLITNEGAIFVVSGLPDQELNTTDSPTFVTVKLSGLTAGYVPYDTIAGLGDGPIFTDGTSVSIDEGFDLATLPLGDNSLTSIGTTVSGTATGSGTTTGIYGLSTTTTLTGDYDSGNFWSCGLYNNMYFSGSGFDQGAMTGIRNDMRISGSGDTSELVLWESQFWHLGSGEVADVYGSSIIIGVNGGGSIPEATIYYGSYSVLSGTIPLKWGIYIDGEDKNYLSGELEVGGAIKYVWKVGSYYFNSTGVDPATELGYGTWVQVGQGQFLVGAT